MTVTFTAPTTYTETTALLGKTVILPNGVEASICGCGSSGDNLHVTFGLATAPVAYWSTTAGFETAAEHKARLWDRSAESLPQNARKLIATVMGDVFSDPDRARLKDPARLVNVAKARLVRHGLLELDNCGRCGGSGHFSRCEMYGTTCFGCAGKGKVFPATGKALKVAVRCDPVTA